MSMEEHAQDLDSLIEFDRPIAFNRALVQVGSVEAALFLSQAIYWHKRTDRAGRWFYKTRDEWEEETGLTRKQQEKARKQCIEAGVIKEVRKGVPAKMWYQVQPAAVRKIVHEANVALAKKREERLKNDQQDGPKRANWEDPNGPTITETTTETTQTDSAPTERQQAAPPVPKQKDTTNHPYRFFEIINEHRSEPMAATAKEMGQCKNLVKYANKDEETLRRKIQLYQADRFWGTIPVTASTLAKAWNGLEGKAPGEKSGWAAKFDKKMNGES